LSSRYRKSNDLGNKATNMRAMLRDKQKTIPGLCGLVMLVLLVFVPNFAYAEPPVVPPDAVEQFRYVIGSRIEAMTVLGGDIGAAGSYYAFHGVNDRRVRGSP
jgi:hypothetical protein